MYATLGDMRGLYGEGEIIALSDRAGIGTADEGLITEALARAGSEADSYLSRRYPLPLAEVPPVLKTVVCDIARHLLTGGPTSETDPIEERYKRAVAWLSDVAAGKADLPIPRPESGAGPEFFSGRRDWAAAPVAEGQE